MPKSIKFTLTTKIMYQLLVTLTTEQIAQALDEYIDRYVVIPGIVADKVTLLINGSDDPETTLSAMAVLYNEAEVAAPAITDKNGKHYPAVGPKGPIPLAKHPLDPEEGWEQA
jgi:hypothetical protein